MGDFNPSSNLGVEGEIVLWSKGLVHATDVLLALRLKSGKQYRRSSPFTQSSYPHEAVGIYDSRNGSRPVDCAQLASPSCGCADMLRLGRCLSVTANAVLHFLLGCVHQVDYLFQEIRTSPFTLGSSGIGHQCWDIHLTSVLEIRCNNVSMMLHHTNDIR